MLRRLLLGSLYCAFGVSAWADSPDVAGLFPSGGRRGTEVSVRAIDSKGARRGRGGRRRRGESKPQEKADTAEWRLWTDAPGIELIEPESDDSLKLKLAADSTPGTHWLRFYTADGASGLRPFVVGNASEVAEAEPNDTLAKAQALTDLPLTVNGALEKAGDVDSFRVTLPRGSTLVAVLAAKQSLGSPMDGLLQIVDAQGFVLEQNDDQRGFDPRIAFASPKDGDYFVRVFAFPAAPDTTIRFSGAPTYIYRLTLTTGPFVDRLTPGAVAASLPAKVRPGGWNLPADVGEVELPPFAAGVQPVFSDAWESTAKILATPSAVVVEQEPNPLASPQPVETPKTLCGVIGEAKDVDAWKFAAKAGQRVSIRLAALSLGSALDAVVRMYDAAGQKTAEVDDAPQDEFDVVMEFTAPNDGEYIVAVTDRFSHGGPGYGYVLSLAEPAPDAVLQVAADAFTVPADKPLEIPVTIERRAGFPQTLNLTVDGLPDGVTTEPVRSEQVDKQVKLVVTSKRTEPWTGPIRIVGRVDGDPREWPARVKSPLTDDWLPHLWLTAPAK